IFEHLWVYFANPQSWRLYDDVPAALAALERRRYQLGIASNFDARFKRIVAGHTPLDVCTSLFLSSDIGFTKPDLRFFRAVEERLGTVPAEIVLIGDDEISDVQGATAAGWRAIRLHRSGKCICAGTI